ADPYRPLPSLHLPSLTVDLENLPSPHAEVDNLLGPAPQRVLPLHRHALHFVTMPARHDVLILGPNLHAIARAELLPIPRHRRLRVEQANRDVAGEILDRTHVDLGVGLWRRHPAGAREIGPAGGEQ